MMRSLTIAWVVWLEMIRRKDVYVLLILLLTLLFVLMSINVFGLGSMVRYVADVGLLFAWIFSVVLAVTTTGRQLPQEESKKTIYPLLAKPLQRSELIFGKWLGCWTITMGCTAAFYLLVLLIVHLRGGVVSGAAMTQGLFLHFMVLGVLVALVLVLSTRMSYGAAATLAYVIIGAAFLIGPKVPELVVNEQGFTVFALLVLYYAFPHMELFDLRQRIVHSWGPAPWNTVLFVAAYGLVWILILLLLAWLGYRKKRFKRGAAG